MASHRAIDSQPRFEQLRQEIGLSREVTNCLLARGYKTASDVAFSLPDNESLELLIQGVMRDDQHPNGGILRNPNIADETLKTPGIGSDRPALRRLQGPSCPRNHVLHYHIGDLGWAYRAGGSTSPKFVA